MPSTAEFDYTDFEQGNQSKADEGLLVKFYMKSVPDRVASTEAGRPMFKDKEYIDIRVPGQHDGVARPATPADKSRFPKHYAAYKNRAEMPTSGTPLAEWPAISRSYADQLSFANIKTVEQLADLNDNTMHQFKGIQNFKQKAIDWLAATKDDAVLSQMRDLLTEREGKIEEQGKQIETLMARLDKLEAE